MKVCIRAHDLGVAGTEQILERLNSLGLDGVQMVCYKAYPDIAQAPGAMTRERAEQIGKAFSDAGKSIPLVGAYFNPIHADEKKVETGLLIFEDYLRTCKAMGCDVVASETGSCNNDEWTYHPGNRTEASFRASSAHFPACAMWPPIAEAPLPWRAAPGMSAGTWIPLPGPEG